MTKKTLPEPTAHNVFPPNKDRKYFEGASDHPFRPQALAFEPVNGWWLAEAALLAYADEPFVRKQFDEAGLPSVTLLSRGGSQCYVAEGPRFSIAAFRGTQVPKSGDDPDRTRVLQEIVKDVEADADFRLVESGQGGFVHAGFKAALDLIWAEVRERLLAQARERRPVWITGHSLGAALATLAADRLGGVRGLYTFGSPAVGNEAFAAEFYVNTYRYAHYRDIVTRVPVFGWYEGDAKRRGDYVHVGAPKYIDHDGRLRDHVHAVPSLGDLTRDVAASPMNRSPRFRLGRLLDIAREPFDDHAPLYYALQAWNVYADSRSDLAREETAAD